MLCIKYLIKIYQFSTAGEKQKSYTFSHQMETIFSAEIICDVYN